MSTCFGTHHYPPPSSVQYTDDESLQHTEGVGCTEQRISAVRLKAVRRWFSSGVFASGVKPGPCLSQCCTGQNMGAISDNKQFIETRTSRALSIGSQGGQPNWAYILGGCRMTHAPWADNSWRSADALFFLKTLRHLSISHEEHLVYTVRYAHKRTWYSVYEYQYFSFFFSAVQDIYLHVAVSWLNFLNKIPQETKQLVVWPLILHWLSCRGICILYILLV